MAKNLKSIERRPQRNRRKANAETSRELLLQAASDLLIERGAYNVSFKEIGERSGVNSALIGYYFKSKTGLMLDVLRRALSSGIDRLDAIYGMTATAEEKLRCHIEVVVDVYSTYPYVNQLMRWLIAQEPEKYGPILAKDLARPSGRLLDRVLQEGIEQGIFRPVEPLLFYLQLIGACDQLFYGRSQLREIFGIEELTDEDRSRFVDGLHRNVMHGLMIGPGDENVDAGIAAGADQAR